jgi:hypothetical protein
MTEMDCRLAIGRATDLNNGEKLTLIFLLTRLDWQTWEGRVSVRDLALITAQSERNIKRQLQSVTDKGWIEREAERRDNGLHHKALIKLNKGMVTDCHHGSDRLSPQVVTDCHHGSDRLSPQVVTDCPISSDKMSPNINRSIYINTDINQDQPNNQPASEVTPSSTRERELDDMRRAALKADCYILAPEHQLSWEVYVRKMYEVTRLHSRQDVREAYLLKDNNLLKQAHELRIAPASLIDWVVYLATEQKASKKLIRR